MNIFNHLACNRRCHVQLDTYEQDWITDRPCLDTQNIYLAVEKPLSAITLN